MFEIFVFTFRKTKNLDAEPTQETRERLEQLLSEKKKELISRFDRQLITKYKITISKKGSRQYSKLRKDTPSEEVVKQCPVEPDRQEGTEILQVPLVQEKSTKRKELPIKTNSQECTEVPLTGREDSQEPGKCVSRGKRKRLTKSRGISTSTRQPISSQSTSLAQDLLILTELEEKST